MATPVLIDGSHFLSRTATGIGSYARTLAAALRTSGCRVAVLYGQRVQERQARHLRLAAQVFGNEPPRSRRLQLLGEILFLLRAAMGGGRSRALPVPLDGVDLSAFEPRLPQCDQVLNAHALFERAHRLFIMKERFIELDLPFPFKAAHWTAPFAIKARGLPNIYTIHDLVPLQFPHFTIDFAGQSVELHAEIARRADHIVTVSETSKRHIVELLKVRDDRVSVTYQPVPDLPQIARADAERLVEAVYGAKPGAYALHLGAIEPKKNLRRLMEAFLLAGLDVPLLLAGPLGWLYDEELALIDVIANQWRGMMIGRPCDAMRGNGTCRADGPSVRQNGMWPNDVEALRHDGAHLLAAPPPRFYGVWPDTGPLIRRLGYLPRHHVVALVQCARFLVFPSIYEGFGLPVLEAMQLGVPVLTSNAGSLPEVAGDAAVLVDPLDVTGMAREIRRLGNDGDLRAELARRGPPQAARFNREFYRGQLALAYRKVGVELDSGPTCDPRSFGLGGVREHQPSEPVPAG